MTLARAASSAIALAAACHTCCASLCVAGDERAAEPRLAKETVLLQLAPVRSSSAGTCSPLQVRVRRRRQNAQMCACRRRSAGEVSQDGWTCDGDTMSAPAPPSAAPGACVGTNVRRRRRNAEMCACRRRSVGEVSEGGWTCDVDAMSASSSGDSRPTSVPNAAALTPAPQVLTPTPEPTAGACAAAYIRRRLRNEEICACRRRSGSLELEVSWACEGDVIVPSPSPSPFFSVAMNISGSELRDKVEGYWVEQLVGNYIGWPFEFQYNDGPMPRLPDRYHDVQDTGGFRINQDGGGRVPETLDRYQGAFTDDDTDIEFVTLHAVEAHGLDITYEEIADEWREHINDKIWVANAKARDLMGQGVQPPMTGMEHINKYWWAIDPQLVNEIWSALHPGMLERAVERAAWGARITNSHWGTHPTLFYAALHSGAFVVSDVGRLYDAAASFIPDSSPFAQGLADVKAWHRANAGWRQTWWQIKERYLHYPDGVWHDVSAMINGLLGAMAFLYGEGDFLRTVGIASSAGYDCDNQAATLGGLLGVMHGSSALPRRLTHDVGSNRWTKPFNDMYKNTARDGLPEDNSIVDIVNRIATIARAAILQSGGAVHGAEGGEVFYEVPVSAALTQTH